MSRRGVGTAAIQIARHLGVPLDNDDWQKFGHQIPLMVNLQPAGEYLGEDYHHAGGVPAVVACRYRRHTATVETTWTVGERQLTLSDAMMSEVEELHRDLGMNCTGYKPF